MFNAGLSALTLADHAMINDAHAPATAPDSLCVWRAGLFKDFGSPICSRDHRMRTGEDLVQVEVTGVPVNLGQARVLPGALLQGDADGVIAIPRAPAPRRSLARYPGVEPLNLGASTHPTRQDRSPS